MTFFKQLILQLTNFGINFKNIAIDLTVFQKKKCFKKKKKIAIDLT